VEAGDRQVVMVVVRVGHPLRKIAGRVVVNTAQRPEAGRGTLGGFLVTGEAADHFPQHFGPAVVAALPHHLVHRPQQVVLDRNGDALHGGSGCSRDISARCWRDASRAGAHEPIRGTRSIRGKRRAGSTTAGRHCERPRAGARSDHAPSDASAHARSTSGPSRAAGR